MNSLSISESPQGLGQLFDRRGSCVADIGASWKQALKLLPALGAWKFEKVRDQMAEISPPNISRQAGPGRVDGRGYVATKKMAFLGTSCKSTFFFDDLDEGVSTLIVDLKGIAFEEVEQRFEAAYGKPAHCFESTWSSTWDVPKASIVVEESNYQRTSIIVSYKH